MFQNKYVVLVSGAAAQPESVRVLTYGYIGGPESGDRPDMKYTPFMLRMLTENLLDQDQDGGSRFSSSDPNSNSAGKQISMRYAVVHTRTQTMAEEIAQDTARLGYAIATGDYEHLLEMEPVSASAGEDDGKGALWTVETSSSRLLLRVTDAKQRDEWIAAVESASPHNTHRQTMMAKDAVGAAISTASAHRATNLAIRQEMQAFRQDPEATLDHWTASSSWAQDVRARREDWPHIWESIDVADGGVDADDAANEELRIELQLESEQSASPAERARARSTSPTIDVDLEEFTIAPVATGQFMPSDDMAAAIARVEAVVAENEAKGASPFKCAVELLKSAIQSDKRQGKNEGKKTPEAVLMYLKAAGYVAQVTNEKQREGLLKKLPTIDERISTALKSPAVLFDELDEDNSGTIDASEFVILMTRLSRTLEGGEFDEIDRDGSGAIDLEEFELWSKHQGLQAPPAPEFYRALCVLQSMPQPVEVDLFDLAAEMKRLNLPKSQAVALSAAETVAAAATKAAADAAALAPPVPIAIGQAEPESELVDPSPAVDEPSPEPEPEPALHHHHHPIAADALAALPASTAAAVTAVKSILDAQAEQTDFKQAVALLRSAIASDNTGSKQESALLYMAAADAMARVEASKAPAKQKDGLAKKLRAVDTRIATSLKTSRSLFDEIDEDNSGAIDEEEFEKLMGLMGMTIDTAEEFAAIDADGSGVIEYGEFEIWSAKSGLKQSHELFLAGWRALLHDDSLELLPELKRLKLSTAFDAADTSMREVQEATVARSTPVAGDDGIGSDDAVVGRLENFPGASPTPPERTPEPISEHDRAASRVSVKIIEARGLPAMDSKRKGLTVARTSDPYVTVKLQSKIEAGKKSPGRKDREAAEQERISRAQAKGRRSAALEVAIKGSQQECQTKVVAESLTPVWNEQLPDFTEIPPLPDALLVFQVLDEDKDSSADDPMCGVEVALAGIVESHSGTFSGWLPLESPKGPNGSPDGKRLSPLGLAGKGSLLGNISPVNLAENAAKIAQSAASIAGEVPLGGFAVDAIGGVADIAGDAIGGVADIAGDAIGGVADTVADVAGAATELTGVGDLFSLGEIKIEITVELESKDSKLFAKLDLDGDGALNLAELRGAVRLLYPKAGWDDSVWEDFCLQYGTDPKRGFELGHFMALREAMRDLGEPESPASQGAEDLAAAAKKDLENAAAAAAEAAEVEAEARAELEAEAEAQRMREAQPEGKIDANAEVEQQEAAAKAAAAEAEAAAEAAEAAAAAAKVKAEEEAAAAAAKAKAEEEAAAAAAKAKVEEEAAAAAAKAKAEEEAAAAAAAAAAQAQAQAEAIERAKADAEAEEAAEAERKAATAAAAAQAEAEAAAEVERQAKAATQAAILANPDGFLWCRKCSAHFPGTICDGGHSNMWYRARNATRAELELEPDPAPAPPQRERENTMERRNEFQRQQRKMLEQVTARRVDSATRLAQWSTTREARQATWERQQRSAGSTATQYAPTAPLAASPRQTEASWQDVTARRTARRQQQAGRTDGSPNATRSASMIVAAWRTSHPPPPSPPAPAPLSPRSPVAVRATVDTVLDPLWLAGKAGSHSQSRSDFGSVLETGDLASVLRQALLDLNAARPAEPRSWLEDYFLQGKPSPRPSPLRSGRFGATQAVPTVPRESSGPFSAYLTSTGVRPLLEAASRELATTSIPPSKQMLWLSEFVRRSGSAVG